MHSDYKLRKAFKTETASLLIANKRNIVCLSTTEGLKEGSSYQSLHMSQDRIAGVERAALPFYVGHSVHTPV